MTQLRCIHSQSDKRKPLEQAIEKSNLSIRTCMPQSLMIRLILKGWLQKYSGRTNRKFARNCQFFRKYVCNSLPRPPSLQNLRLYPNMKLYCLREASETEYERIQKTEHDLGQERRFQIRIATRGPQRLRLLRFSLVRLP